MTKGPRWPTPVIGYDWLMRASKQEPSISVCLVYVGSTSPTALCFMPALGAENASVPAVHDQEEVETEEAPASPQSTTPASTFVLTGKPFLRAIFRSLEVGPGTDYDTLYALNLLIALKMNGCELQLAPPLTPPSQNV
ncbi:unnamed protein product [Dibothriocephalus latus]|uniref:Uncharacterized protein n=1 Tax=Dibothriocephalus latus TaxID=60516 RepID=A0A3P7LWV4_DIBLA|nr:unnamed protein product [Dibothriocephalus latus]